jgi:hypothetical protein
MPQRRTGKPPSTPLEMTEEHVKLARQGRGKEVFEELLARQQKVKAASKRPARKRPAK